MTRKVENLDSIAGAPLIIHVITTGTADYGGAYVVRRHGILEGSTLVENSCLLYETLGAARAAMPFGSVALARDPDDDPVIVETWL